MSIIYSYPEQGALNPNDMLIGTSAEVVGGKQKNITRNFSIQQIADYINDGGAVFNPAATDFQIAVFNQGGTKLTGSIISQNTFPNGTFVTIAGDLTANAATLNGAVGINGFLTLNGGATLGSGTAGELIAFGSTTRLNAPIQDQLGRVGALDQVLISDTAGRVSWQNYTSGLTYTGTWDALNNVTAPQGTPIVSSSGTNGEFYIVTLAGNTPLNGQPPAPTTPAYWQVGDWVVFVEDGGPGVWQKIDNSSAITGTGTDNKITMWTGGATPSTSLTDSIMSQNAGNTTITVTGSLAATVDVSAVNVTTTGTVTPTTITDKDSGVGTAGQILSSTETAGVAGVGWIDNQVGTVTGTGATNALTLWSDGATGVLGDSIVDQSAAGGVFADLYLNVKGTSGGLSLDGSLQIDRSLWDGGAGGNTSAGTDGQVLTSSTQGVAPDQYQEVKWVDPTTIGDIYTFGSSTDPAVSARVRLDLDATTGSDSFVTLIGSGVAITQASDVVTFTVPAGDTYDLGSVTSTIANSVEVELTSGSTTDNSEITLTGAGGLTITQANDVVTLTAPTGSDTTYTLAAGSKTSSSVPLNLSPSTGSDTTVNLTEGTGITLTQTSATEITIEGTAQGVTGSGTSGKLPKFDTATSLDDSIVTQSGGITTITPLINNVIGFSPQTSQFTMTSYATNNTVTGPVPQVGDVLNFVLTSDLTWAVGGGVIPAGTYPFTITFVGSGSLNCSFNSYTIPASASGYGYNNMLGNGSSTSVNPIDVLAIDGELSMVTHQIKNVVDPTDAQDAATKYYVDSIPRGVMTFGTSDSGATITVSGGASDPRVKANTAAVTSASTSLATGSQIQSAIDAALVGFLEFKGGFNAATGFIDGGTDNLTVGAARVAVEIGDFYIVTTAGNFYGVVTEPLAIGDQVIAITAYLVGDSLIAGWVKVQQNIGVATDTVQGIANFPTGNNQLNIATGSVTAKTFGDGTLATSITGGYVPNATSAATGTFLSKTGSWVSTVTSVGLSSDVAALTVGSTPVTGSGTLTLNRNGGTAGQYIDGATGAWTDLPAPGTGTVTGTGAATQVAFWDATSNINGDAAFNWDNSNKRLGIGTNSPAEKLDVAGAIISTGGITGHGANRTTISQEGANGAFWQSYGANSSTYGTFTLRQASSDFSFVRVPLTIDSSGNSTFTGDNVSLTSSVARLKLGADGGYGEIQRGQSSNGTSTILYIGETADSGATIFRGSGNTSFESNVGIGTTSPSAKLEVKDSSTNLQMRVGSLTAGISPAIRLQGKNTANTTSYYADISLDAENGKLIFNDPGTSGGSIGQNPMVLDSAGNVGIGTTSPLAPLSVVSASSANQALAQTWQYDSSNNYNLELKQTVTSGVVRWTFDQINNGTAYPDVMTFDRGNVGIGTASPDALLEISGNAGADPGPITNPTTFRITDAGNAASGSGDIVNPWGKIEFYSEDTSSSGPSVQTQIASIYDNIYSYASSLAFSTRTQPGTPLTTRMKITSIGALVFNAYGSGTRTGTATYSLAVDSSGNVIEEPVSSGGGTITKQLFAVGATATTAFPLTSGINPADINYVNIFIDGVYQNSGSYTVSTTGTTTTVTLSASVSNVSVEIVSTT